ncbi:phosphatidylglycerophosphatase mitochondrial [Fusarium heterosporum]|uniref:Phosphatidylglycerophosphatase mitochondrial n=1 Tax=Fusarium heterosporum TaxID=42747 RepID=A0A8H5WJM6_FUSHE|nr:phosphatidylglycerophosphatase mitochondrial [Fusarium heterosporum]
MLNLNLSASLNITRLIFKPSLCLPHHTVSTFNELPIPLEKGLQKDGRKVEIKAVVLDKDDCFAYPDSIEIYDSYKTHFEKLRQAYPGRKLLVVSNTAGATSWDKNLKLAAEVEENTGITVLPHSVKKPGCGQEIMEYFKKHPETGVTDPAHVAFVGDRLTTDMMLANMTGGWGFWVKDGVIPFEKKNVCPISRGLSKASCHIMGGKVWSEEEERIFWEDVIPRSTVAANPPTDPTVQPLSWPDCAKWMNENAGDKPRRVYTSTMLYEHHYQNIKPGAKSPKAVRFVQKYLSDCEYYTKHNSPRPPSPPRVATPQDPQLVALLEEQLKRKNRRPRKATHPQKRQIESLPGPRPTYEYEDDSQHSYESRGESSGQSTPTEPRTCSFTPTNRHLHRQSGESQAFTRGDFNTRYQPDRRALLNSVPSNRPGEFPSRPAEFARNGSWRFEPQNLQKETSREATPMALQSTNIQPQRSYAPQRVSPWTIPAQQSHEEPRDNWSGKLPSIRQMLSFEGLGQPGYSPPYTHDTAALVNKRVYYDGQSYDSEPKRRRLPNHSVSRQGDQQQSQQRDGNRNE